MSKGRLEAFSDGVLAIIITIMVLELKLPHHTDAAHEPDLATLRPLWPVFVSYVLSFAHVAIYWNNHHHLFQAVERVTGPVLWANSLLLFCLSLIPFTTHWMGSTAFAPWPVALYGVVLLLAGGAYFVLVHALLACHGPGSALRAAIGWDVKGVVSVGLYAAAIPLAFFSVWVSCALYAAVAVIWMIPDLRIEKTLAERKA